MVDRKDVELYEALLRRHLAFYEALRTRARRPKTSAQRQFQDVAWGKAEPVTDHEQAYAYYLRKRRAPAPSIAPDDDGIEHYPPGQRPISFDTGRKWDEPWVDTPGSGHLGRRALR